MKYFHFLSGQYSEEAAEARNKDLKCYNKLNTREISREATNGDIELKLAIRDRN